MPGLGTERVKRQSKAEGKTVWTLWWLMEEEQFNGGAEDRQIIGVMRWSELAYFPELWSFKLVSVHSIYTYSLHRSVRRDMHERWQMQSRSPLKY
jgi:hypothetical protein